MLSSPISSWRGVGQTLGDALGHRDRARRGEAAIIHAGAGDDVGDQTDIGGREPGLRQRRHSAGSIILRHMRQHQILLMGDADLAEASTVGEIGHAAPSASALASPGMPPTGFSEMVTMA